MDWKKLINGLRQKFKQPKINLVTFGNNHFTERKIKLANQAREIGWFDKIFYYGEDDVLSWGYEKSLSGRGAGYYWWKPVIVLKALENINDGEILLYLDAGCSIQKEYESRFFEYIKLLKSAPCNFLGFHIDGHKEKHFTKRDLFLLLGCDEKKYTDTPQIISGIFFVIKNEKTISILEEWKKICQIDHAINDDVSVNLNYENFEAHRHDQSVLSLLIKKYNGLSISDETHTSSNQFPLIATRYWD